MNRTQNVLATVAPSFLVTKTTLLCLGVKSISEMRIVQAQESACEDGEGLRRKVSQDPVDVQPAPPQPSILIWVQDALELVLWNENVEPHFWVATSVNMTFHSITLPHTHTKSDNTQCWHS